MQKMEQPPPDPVSAPAEYQRFLLGFLRDDDPAEVQAATSAQIRALVAEAGDALRIRPPRRHPNPPRIQASVDSGLDRGFGAPGRRPHCAGDVDGLA
jgi:hypothetical protein